MTWKTSPTGARGLTDRAGHHAMYVFTPDGLRVWASLPSEESAHVTLEPADALALAADIQREYGGKE